MIDLDRGRHRSKIIEPEFLQSGSGGTHVAECPFQHVVVAEFGSLAPGKCADLRLREFAFQNAVAARGLETPPEIARWPLDLEGEWITIRTRMLAGIFLGARSAELNRFARRLGAHPAPTRLPTARRAGYRRPEVAACTSGERTPSTPFSHTLIRSGWSAWLTVPIHSQAISSGSIES